MPRECGSTSSVEVETDEGSDTVDLVCRKEPGHVNVPGEEWHRDGTHEWADPAPEESR